jgi:transposase
MKNTEPSPTSRPDSSAPAAPAAPPAPAASPAVASPPGQLDDGTPLPDDVAVLQQMIRELLDSLQKVTTDRDGLQQRLDLLLRRLYGPKAERFDPNQPWLFPELAQGAATAEQATAGAEAAAAADESPADQGKRKGHGRKPLPEELPRRRVEHTLSEAQRLCPDCGVVCEKFGEQISEQLDYQPASLFVWQHVRFKYACKKCHDHVTTGHVPVAVVNRGLPGPGLLAQIAASKYADHLPLHRLERILGRHGISLNRSTLCDWMAHVAGMLRPVVELLATEVRLSYVIHADATKMPFVDPEQPGKTRSGQMWAYVGDREHPFDVFDFCEDHSAKGIDAFLKANNYRGHLNADALNLYDHLFTEGKVVEVGCWAHCRRNFYEAKESDPGRAHAVLAWIKRLYAVEEEASKRIAAEELAGEAADAVRVKLRQVKSLAETTALKRWLEQEQSRVLPKSLMGGAIAYALRHWQALTRFLSDGRLAIDNNIAERTLRHIAIGRKNWLFAGSAEGARTAQVLFSIASSCHRHGVDVFAYLRDLLERLAHEPKPKDEQLRPWLPDRWRPAGAAESVSGSNSS